MARDFASASSQYAHVKTGLGNFEWTQAWSVWGVFRTKSNASGNLIGRQEGSGNFRGWGCRTRAGAASPQFAMAVGSTGTIEANVRTSSEFSIDTYRTVGFTYDGSGVVAGMHIWVGAADQTLVTIDDTLAGSTILNSVEMQVGCRGGISAAAFFGNFLVRRLALYNVALTSTEIGTLDAGASLVTRGLLAWWECGPLNDGATLMPDWSGNGHVLYITGASYSTTDPTITALTPTLPTNGAGQLSGPLTKTASPPLLQNLGWAGGANTGVGDQIGPGSVLRFGPNDYRGWFENDTGGKSLDVAHQAGAFDFDTPSIYGTSPDGIVWTLFNQNVPASAVFSCNNLGGDATFKAAVQAETSISSLLFDTDDQVWKCWFHGGNNSGTRKVYYATCAGNPSVAGNWAVQNGGVAVLTVGAGGSWDSTFVADFKVVRVNASLMVATYLGYNGATQKIGKATSADRGLTWTKYASNPVISPSDAGLWTDGEIYNGALAYEPSLRLYMLWYGSKSTFSGAQEAINFAWSADAQTWTHGTFNPVLCKRDGTSSQNAFEYAIATTLSVYLDGVTWRLFYRGDNGVSGTSAFRGRLEAILLGPGSILVSGKIIFSHE